MKAESEKVDTADSSVIKKTGVGEEAIAHLTSDKTRDKRQKYSCIQDR